MQDILSNYISWVFVVVEDPLPRVCFVPSFALLFTSASSWVCGTHGVEVPQSLIPQQKAHRTSQNKAYF